MHANKAEFTASTATATALQYYLNWSKLRAYVDECQVDWLGQGSAPSVHNALLRIRLSLSTKIDKLQQFSHILSKPYIGFLFLFFGE